MRYPPRDDGFVLVEVLVAAVILAGVGTAAYSLGIGMFARIDKNLDASVAFVNLEERATELVALGVSGQSLLTPLDDGVYQYQVADVSTGADLKRLLVHATITGEQAPWRSVPVLLVPAERVPE